ncbi:MAG: glycoside hydrolase family 2, partial [Armatimonadota bacterium]|nr:glycoside hydrolase family 2 [Armatimonadota bacterium]
VITDLPLPDNSQADLTIHSELRNVTQQAQHGVLRGVIEGIRFEQPVDLPAGETKTITFSPKEFPQLKVHSPRLWWPNGYGRPELYTLKLSLQSGGAVSDEQNVRFGIRKFTYHFEPHLTLLVNGRRILCKGGNWGMDDGMKRVSRERLEPYIRLHRDANLNMIRNWTGESTEEDLFSLCDEYGILVWNDFWISTAGYNLEPTDPDLFLANARDVILRFRNHPSIAIWCGRNEGVPPEPINSGLDRLVREIDGTRYYQPSSININLKHSGPWSYQDPATYFTDIAYGFTTELGMPSIPTVDAMQAMMPEPDRWPPGDTWDYHDMHHGANGGSYWEAMDRLYGHPTSLEDCDRKAQLLNYVGIRAMFEAWNSKLFNPCSGMLVWMSHPAWPSTMWQFYSSDYDPNSALFAAKEACEPIHVQMNLPDSTVAVVNNGRLPLDAAVSAQVYSMDGKEAGRQDANTTAAPEACTTLFRVQWPSSKLSPVSFLKLELKDRQGKRISDNFYWRAEHDGDYQQLNKLPPAPLKADVLVTRDNKVVRLTAAVQNPSTAMALMIHLTLRDRVTGKRILPVYYSDNYFSLPPGTGRTITIECAAKDALGPLELSDDGWNIPGGIIPAPTVGVEGFSAVVRY